MKKKEYLDACLYFNGIDHINIALFNKFIKVLYFNDGSTSKSLASLMKMTPSACCSLMMRYRKMEPAPIYYVKSGRENLNYLTDIGKNYYEECLLANDVEEMAEKETTPTLNVFDAISNLNIVLKTIDASNNPYLLLLKAMDMNMVLSYLEPYEFIYLIAILSGDAQYVLNQFDLRTVYIEKKKILEKFKKLIDIQYRTFENKMVGNEIKQLSKSKNN